VAGVVGLAHGQPSPPVNQPLGPLDLCQYAELNRPGVSGHLTSRGKAKVKLTSTRPSNNYPPELREGAILLNWVRRAQVDAGQQPGFAPAAAAALPPPSAGLDVVER